MSKAKKTNPSNKKDQKKNNKIKSERKPTQVKKNSDKKVEVKEEKKETKNTSKQQVSKKKSYSTVDKSQAKILNTPTIIGLVVIVLVSLAYMLRGYFLAAMVNGQPIGRLQIMRQAEQVQGQQILEQKVLEALIVQKAREEGIEISENAVDAQVEDIKQSVSEQGQDFDQLLALQGMTLEDLRFQIRLNQIVEQLLGNDLQVSDEEINQFLDQNAEYLPEDQSEEELKTLAREQLQQQKMSEQYQSWVEELKQNANINYFVGYAPEEAPVMNSAPVVEEVPAEDSMEQAEEGSSESESAQE